MSKTNVQVVQEFVEQVLNNQHFERAFEYCAEDCILHQPPFVGLGFITDDSSGDKLVITHVAPNSPAAGNLQAGDEIVRVSDSAKTWETFKDVKSRLWGPGVTGTPVTFSVKRAGQLMDIPLKRGLMEGFEAPLSGMIDGWRESQLRDWPDLKVDIKLIFGEGDLVAFYAIDSGTNQEFHRSAVWGDASFCRLKDGKIVEMWGVEDTDSQIKQLGYQVLAPA